MHSLLYRVEQVFLIHRETGLVLNHVVAPSAPAQDADYGRGAALRDPAVRTRLLSAWANRKSRQHDLRRIADSCRQRSKRRNRGGDSRPRARNLQPGDERNSGRNSAPCTVPRWRNFTGDPGPFRAAESQIARLLETQYREKPPETRRPRAAIVAGAIAAVLLLGWVGYSTYLLIEWSRFLSEMRKQPGIVVVSYTKDGRTFHIQGFRDPLSEDPKKLISQAGLDPDSADLQLAPYYSLDDAIVARRATALLHPPAGVTLSAKNGELIPEGSAPQNWIAQLEEKAPWIAGVSRVDESHLQNSSLQQLNALRGTLESVVLLFPLGRAELDAGQETNLAQSEKNIRALDRTGRAFAPGCDRGIGWPHRYHRSRSRQSYAQPRARRPNSRSAAAQRRQFGQPASAWRRHFAASAR